MTLCFKQQFDSWAEFDEIIKRLERTQEIAIVCNDSKKFPKESQEILLYDYKYKEMTCPRSGTYKIPESDTSKSLTSDTSDSTVKISRSKKENCPFKIRANFNLKLKKIEITQLNLKHVHPSEIVGIYPNEFLELNIDQANQDQVPPVIGHIQVSTNATVKANGDKEEEGKAKSTLANVPIKSNSAPKKRKRDGIEEDENCMKKPKAKAKTNKSVDTDGSNAPVLPSARKGGKAKHDSSSHVLKQSEPATGLLKSIMTNDSTAVKFVNHAQELNNSIKSPSKIKHDEKYVKTSKATVKAKKSVDSEGEKAKHQLRIDYAAKNRAKVDNEQDDVNKSHATVPTRIMGAKGKKKRFPRKYNISSKKFQIHQTSY